MAYEYRTAQGVIQLLRLGSIWTFVLGDRLQGQWASATDAIEALSKGQTAIPALDRLDLDVPGSLDEWRPLGEAL